MHYDNYWYWAYFDTDGVENNWLGGLKEIGMSNAHNRAFGNIKSA